MPTGVRVGTDLLALATPYFDDTFKEWEMSADVDFDRFYFVAEVGYWAKDLST